MDSARLSCPFCWEWVEEPASLPNSYSGDAVGGRCECGAVFAIDSTGKSGGLTLLDCMTLACDGSLDAALELESGKDYEVKTKPYQSSGNTLGRMRGHSYLQPQAWFLKLSAR